MKRFAVGYINFFDNELVVEIVEAETWKEACFNHSCTKCEDGKIDTKSIKNSPDDKEDFGQWCFEGDFQVGVIEIPES